MPNIIETTIELINPGDTLVVERGGRQVLFQVEKKNFASVRGEGSVLTLESEPVDGGEPWTITGPPGTIVRRIVRM